MQVKHSKEDDLTHKFIVTANEEYVKGVIGKLFSKTRLKAKLDGYRTGKIPDNMITKHFSANILESVYKQLMDESNKAIKETVELKLSAEPQTKVINIPQSLDDSKFEIEVVIEAMPEIIIPDFTTIKLDNYNLTLTNDNEKEAYKRFASLFATRKSKEGKVVDGDIVNIDYETLEGAKETIDINVDANNHVTSKFIGMKIGDSTKITIPKSATVENDTEVLSTVNLVYSRELPNFDEGLVKQSGLKDLETMKAEAINFYKRKYIDDIRSLVKKHLFDILNETVKFPLPKQIVHAELHNIAHQSGNAHDCDVDHTKDENISIAERRVKLALLLQEIAQKSKIQVSQEEAIKKLQEIASMFKMELNEFLQNLSSKEIINNVVQQILEDKTVDFILENAKVSKKDITISDLEKMLKKEGLDA